MARALVQLNCRTNLGTLCIHADSHDTDREPGPKHMETAEDSVLHQTPGQARSYTDAQANIG